MCSVAFCGICREERVEVGEVKCVPACTRRRSEAGRLWRRARRAERVERDVEDGIVRGTVVVPETSLMKICMVSSSNESTLLMESERRMLGKCVAGVMVFGVRMKRRR